MYKRLGLVISRLKYTEGDDNVHAHFFVHADMTDG